MGENLDSSSIRHYHLVMFGISRNKNPLERAVARRRIKRVARRLLGLLGLPIPFSVKIRLARHSSKLAYLLLYYGDLILEDYLGCYRFKVNARSEIQRVLISQSYEPDVLAVIHNWVREGDCCVDVGANVGAIAFAMAQRVGDNGKVHCFEPGPPYAERLRENIKLNPRLREIIEVHPLGLSDKEGELIWGEDLDLPGNAYLLGNKGTPVSVTTLDHFLMNNRGLKINFMKIDIEGMEWEMLSGSQETLKRHRPLILFETRLEFEIGRGIPVLKMTEDLLNSFDYDLYRIDDTGGITKTQYPLFSPNTLAIPK